MYAIKSISFYIGSHYSFFRLNSYILRSNRFAIKLFYYISCCLDAVLLTVYPFEKNGQMI